MANELLSEVELAAGKLATSFGPDDLDDFDFDDVGPLTFEDTRHFASIVKEAVTPEVWAKFYDTVLKLPAARIVPEVACRHIEVALKADAIKAAASAPSNASGSKRADQDGAPQGEAGEDTNGGGGQGNGALKIVLEQLRVLHPSYDPSIATETAAAEMKAKAEDANKPAGFGAAPVVPTGLGGLFGTPNVEFGDIVKLKPSCTNDNIDHDCIGKLARVIDLRGNDNTIITMLSGSNTWQCHTKHFEVKGKTELPKGIAIGSKVKVKPGATPVGGWGSVTTESVGVITALRRTGEDGYGSADSDDNGNNNSGGQLGGFGRPAGGLFGASHSLFGAASPSPPAFAPTLQRAPSVKLQGSTIICVVDFEEEKGWEAKASELEVIEAASAAKGDGDAAADAAGSAGSSPLLDHYLDETTKKEKTPIAASAPASDDSREKLYECIVSEGVGWRTEERFDARVGSATDKSYAFLPGVVFTATKRGGWLRDSKTGYYVPFEDKDGKVLFKSVGMSTSAAGVHGSDAWRPLSSYQPCGKQAPLRNSETRAASTIGVTQQRPISRETFLRVFGKKMLEPHIGNLKARYHKVTPTMVLAPQASGKDVLKSVEEKDSGDKGKTDSGGDAPVPVPDAIKTLLLKDDGERYEEALMRTAGKNVLLNFCSRGLELYPKKKAASDAIYDPTAYKPVPEGDVGELQTFLNEAIDDGSRRPIEPFRDADASQVLAAMRHYRAALGRDRTADASSPETFHDTPIPWQLAFNKPNITCVAFKLTRAHMGAILKAAGNPMPYEGGPLYREETYSPWYRFEEGDWVLLDVEPDTNEPRLDEKYGQPLVRTVDGTTFEQTYQEVAKIPNHPYSEKLPSRSKDFSFADLGAAPPSAAAGAPFASGLDKRVQLGQKYRDRKGRTHRTVKRIERNDPPPAVPAAVGPPVAVSTEPAFQPTTAREPGSDKAFNYMSISKMAEHADKSAEELRYTDYVKGGRIQADDTTKGATAKLTEAEEAFKKMSTASESSAKDGDVAAAAAAAPPPPPPPPPPEPSTPIGVLPEDAVTLPPPRPMDYVPSVPNCTGAPLDPLDAAALALFAVFGEVPHAPEAKVGAHGLALQCSSAVVVKEADAALTPLQPWLCSSEVVHGGWDLLSKLAGVDTGGVRLSAGTATTTHIPFMMKRGAIWHLATGNGKRSYHNPHKSGAVLASMSSKRGSSSKEQKVVEVQPTIQSTSETNSTDDTSGSWMALDLGEGTLLCPDGYDLRTDSDTNGSKLRTWHLQASNDGKDWVSLRKHTDDKTLKNTPFSTAHWGLDPSAVKGRSFRRFRVLLTGPNAAGNNRLALCGIELYGYLQTKEGTAKRLKEAERLKELRCHAEVAAIRPAGGEGHEGEAPRRLCYVRHPSQPVGLFCNASALFPQKAHAAARTLTRAARHRLWQRSVSAKRAVVVIKFATRLFLTLRRTRTRRVQERAPTLLREASNRLADIRRRAALRELDELLTSQGDALLHPDGVGVTLLKAALHACGEEGAEENDDKGQVQHAARLIVRAERMREMRSFLSRVAPLPPLLLQDLFSIGDKEAAASGGAASSSSSGGNTSNAAPTAPTVIIPADAKRKMDKSVAALKKEDWDAAATTLDEVRTLLEGKSITGGDATRADMLYALALASDPESRDKAEAWDIAKAYGQHAAETAAAECEPLLLLLLARLDYGGAGSGGTTAAARPKRSPAGLSCLVVHATKIGVSLGDPDPERCYLADEESLMSAAELSEIREDEAQLRGEVLAVSRQSTSNAPPPLSRLHSFTAEEQWKGKADEDGDSHLPSASLDEIMKLRGLQSVKQLALELHTQVQAEKRLPEAMRVKTVLNFSLLGNPGTGKTTAARLLGKLLNELGLRENATFVATSGEEMARNGADDAQELIQKADGGVLFIDEAYDLDPAKNGTEILSQLLTAAEDKRETLTIIMAGYKDDIEDKLYAANAGLKSRFRDLIFDDFSQGELKEIFIEFAEKHSWPLAPQTAELASRRVARRRGVKGFANARDVRKLFEDAYRRATNRIDREDKAARKEQAARRGGGGGGGGMGGGPQDMEVEPVAAASPAASAPASDASHEKLYECINPSGVAWRSEERFDARVGGTRGPSQGDTISATKQGGWLHDSKTGYYLPIEDKDGKTFFRPVGMSASEAASSGLPEEALSFTVGCLVKVKGSIVTSGELPLDFLGKTGRVKNADDPTMLHVSFVIDKRRNTSVTYLLSWELFENQGEQTACDSTCNLDHSNDGPCLVCGQDYGNHAGHTCISGIHHGSRGQWPSGKAGGVKKPAFCPPAAAGGAAAAAAAPAAKAAPRAPFEASKLEIALVDIIGPPPDINKMPDLKAALAELDRQIGLETVKEQVHQLVEMAKINYQRESRLEPPHLIPLNRLFLGSPGTGKTTVAKLYGRILKGLGYLSDGSVEEKAPQDLISSHVGGTEEKTSALINNCKGKVLIIDEAYGLNEGSYGQIAINTLVSMVHNKPGEDIAIIMLGYEEDMLKMLREANPGLQGRFSPESAMKFSDFTDKQLEELLCMEASAANLRWARRSVRKAALKQLVQERIRPNFRNAGSVKNLMGRVKTSVAARGDAKEILLADLGLDENASGGSAEAAKLLAEVEAELSQLVGRRSVEMARQHFKTLGQKLDEWEKSGELDPDRPAAKVGSYIMVGKPGTGKTSFAKKILCKFLRAKGVLASGAFVEKAALQLQGEYLGTTKKNVDETMAAGVGGMVFIDEAYNLGSSRQHSLYQKEAVDQLTFCMTEDTHRDRTVVVLAGYEREMDDMLSSVNPGFSSRFVTRLEFPEWDEVDVLDYLEQRASKKGHTLAENAKPLLLSGFAEIRKRPGWASARDAGRFFDDLSGCRTVRLAALGEESAAKLAEEASPTYTKEDAKQALANLEKRRAKPIYENKRATPPREEEEEEEPMVDMGGMGPKEVELEVEQEEERIQEIDGEDDPPNGGMSVAFALQVTCVELGYDEDNEMRKKLVSLLEGCETDKAFPDDIMSAVCRKTGKKKDEVIDEMRAQVEGVLESMGEAIKQAEQEQYKKDAPYRAKLKEMCLCPAGFDWHREGMGWRCNGGSHTHTFPEA